MSQGSVIIKFNGGLGNQMFQWAIGRTIKELLDFDVLFDDSYFKKKYARPYQLDIFGINPDFVESTAVKTKLEIIWMLRSIIRFPGFLGYTLFSEKQFNFDNSIYKITPNTYIEGFFQSELYFKQVEDILRQDFNFVTAPDLENRKVINEIEEEAPSISLHIRRGDYVQKTRFQELYATCSIDYYKRAVEYIAKQYQNPHIFIFSDDITWVRQNLRLPYKSTYVKHNKGENSYEDMRLMSLCKHNIIANSSFSWWGAWLNKNPDKIVIAPKKWFNDDNIVQTDVIPKSWIQLDN